MTHTKEPWFIPTEPLSLRGKICSSNEDSVIGIFVVADTNHNYPETAKADAKRIVSCVNALEGLSNEALEGGWNFKEMSYYTKSLELRIAQLESKIAAGEIFINGSIKQLCLSVRAYNGLRYNNINTISELLAASKNDLLKMPGIGRSCTKEIIEKIVFFGLSSD